MNKVRESTVAFAVWSILLLIVIARLLPVALTADKMPHPGTVIFAYYLYVFRMLA